MGLASALPLASQLRELTARVLAVPRKFRREMRLGMILLHWFGGLRNNPIGLNAICLARILVNDANQSVLQPLPEGDKEFIK